MDSESRRHLPRPDDYRGGKVTEDKTRCCGCGDKLEPWILDRGQRWCDLCQIEIKDSNKETLGE